MKAATAEPTELVAVPIRKGCELTGLTAPTIYKLIRSGEVLTAKMGRARLIDWPSLKTAVARRMGHNPVDAATSAEFRRRIARRWDARPASPATKRAKATA